MNKNEEKLLKDHRKNVDIIHSHITDQFDSERCDDKLVNALIQVYTNNFNIGSEIARYDTAKHYLNTIVQSYGKFLTKIEMILIRKMISTRCHLNETIYGSMFVDG